MRQAQSLRKSYGPRTVVDDLSLQVQAGQIVGLLGPNGAGKSTTVAMLCGLVAPDASRVLFSAAAGRPGGVMGSGAPALKRRIGLVPQDLALFEDLSAEANLAPTMTALLALFRNDLKLYLGNRRALFLGLLAPIAIAASFGHVFDPGRQKASRMPSFLFPEWLQTVALVVPTRWAVDGLDAVTWRGQGLDAALASIGAMLAFAAAFTLLALWRFDWQEA